MLTPAQLRDFPWKALTWLIVNEGELETLLKAFDATPTDLTLGVQENASKEIIALHNCKAFHQGVSIICTLGSLGVLYFQPGRGVHHMAAAMLRNPLKDTTGAGDCFAGYFVAGLMTAEDEEEHAALLYAINNSIIVSDSSSDDR
jgi:ribokinase